MAVKLILDTHVLLEWLLWQSPRHAWLHAALTSRSVSLVCDEHTLKEWQQVLGYPSFTLDDAEQLALQTRYRELCDIVEYAEQPALPNCKDPNDQKFLRLAFLANVDALLTRDKKLLKIGKHKIFKSAFATLSPEAWVAKHSEFQAPTQLFTLAPGGTNPNGGSASIPYG